MMDLMAKITGIAGTALQIVFVLVIIFFNPYRSGFEEDVMVSFFLMSILPALCALYSAIMSKKHGMLIAFVWSLPLNLYMMATPGIFNLMITSSALFLISWILLKKSKRTTELSQKRT
jgi:hypothetical protein